MIPYQNLARQICETGRLLDGRGFIAATEGNISARIDHDRILCTPSMAEKGKLESYTLCMVDLSGRQVSGPRPRTSELHLHLELYRHNPLTSAVVHCHPPYATAAAVSSAPLPTGLLAETEYCLQDIPVVPYVRPGSPDLGSALSPFAKRCRCALLRNHGAVTWAQDLATARWYMEMLEAYCRTVILARPLGPYACMNDEEVAELRASAHHQQTRNP